ncbi:MAG TPA: PIN domain-containing protein [Pyrinomonadaceae bacterium]
MNFYLTDTHALYWYLVSSPSLGAGAGSAFDEADNGLALIYIPAIVVAELYFLNEKKQHPLDFVAKYERLEQSQQFVLLPFFPATTLHFDACRSILEMHDRMIVADARLLSAPLITRDRDIIMSGLVQTIW